MERRFITKGRSHLTPSEPIDFESIRISLDEEGVLRLDNQEKIKKCLEAAGLGDCNPVSQPITKPIIAYIGAPRRHLRRRKSRAVPAGSWATSMACRHYTPALCSSSFHFGELHVLTMRGMPPSDASRVSVAQGGPGHVPCTRPYGPPRVQRCVRRRCSGVVHRTG